MDLREAANPTNRHPWETARYRFFVSELERAGAFAARTTVLDVGSGDGWFAEGLAKEHFSGSQITCFDVNYPERRTELNVGSNTVLRTNEPSAMKFNIVLLLDVLEHIEDDLGFLSALVANNLADGAKVLISVPAWPQVWTPHDEFLRHFRRYSPSTALELIRQARLRPVRSGGLFHSLLPLRALQRLLHTTRTDQAATRWNAGRLVSKALAGALGVDTWVSRRLASAGFDVPGLSWWALCEAESPKLK